MADEEALNPTARSPSASIAALPIQRQVLSGWYVLCWAKAGVPEVTLRISHQRIPATLPDETVKFPTSASCPSWNRRYAERNIGRSPMPSSRSVVPPCGTHERPRGQSWVKDAGARLPAKVNVEAAGLPKSTWKR